MKATYRIAKIKGDVITLGNGNKYRANIFDSATLSLWSPVFDKVSVEDSDLSVKLTNESKGETIKTEQVHYKK